MYITQISSQYPLVLGVTLLFMEATAIFTTPRWLFKEHGLKEGNTIMSVDSAFIFLSFIFCRIIFQTIILVWSMLPYGYYAFFKAGFDAFYLATCIFMAITVFINFGLNCFWMHLINKQVYRLVKGTAD